MIFVAKEENSAQFAASLLKPYVPETTVIHGDSAVVSVYRQHQTVWENETDALGSSNCSSCTGNWNYCYYLRKESEC